jgi:hypothetical protein
VQVTNVTITEFCLSADVYIINSSNDGDFKITGIYGPMASNRKDDFFAELISQKPAQGISWLALGDFNQIRRAREKINGNINRSRINRFRAALQTCELKEIHLQNHRFTWSNRRANPTLCNLDAFFCNDEWDLHSTHTFSTPYPRPFRITAPSSSPTIVAHEHLDLKTFGCACQVS